MMLRLVLTVLFVLPIVVVVPNCANADVTITYGTVDMGTGTVYIDLQAETAGQAVQFFATGIVADGGADALVFAVQIGDGGADNPAGAGSDTTPVMSSIDLITGTIWASHSPSQSDQEVHPLVRQSIVDTTSLATTDGLIATIVFDTTGFGTDEIDFLLTNVAGGAASTTFFQGVPQLTTIAPNGIIRVTAIPEPAGAMLVVGSLVGLGFRRRRFSA